MATEFTVILPDVPGSLVRFGQALGDARVNIDAVYVTTKGHVVLGVDDLAGAIHVAEGMAVMIGEGAAPRIFRSPTMGDAQGGR